MTQSTESPPPQIPDAASFRNALQHLDQVLSLFFCPLLKHNAVESATWSDSEESVVKFAEYLASLRNENASHRRIDIPVVHVGKARRSEAEIQELEGAVSAWTETLSEVVHGAPAPSESTPLGELEFWRQRVVVLSSLSEQLDVAAVHEILSVLDDSKAVQSFKQQLQQLEKFAAEARDNVKFLATLERHFKTLEKGSFLAMEETLPAMMNALRMIWVLSRYYSDDQKMTGLFRKIARQIGDRVEEAVDVRRVFKREAKAALSLLAEAGSFLQSWRLVYLQVRESIEASRRDVRWEFSRTMLFERTQHIGLICQDLGEMVEIVEDFHQFLGPELKSVIGTRSLTQALDWEALS